MKTACSTCHFRKIRCDLAMATLSNSPCTNCKRAERTDCRRHRRKVRGASLSPTRPGLQTLLGKGGESETERERLQRLGEELRGLGEKLLAKGGAVAVSSGERSEP